MRIIWHSRGMNGNNKENAGEEIILTIHHEESAVGSQHLSGIIFPVLETHYLIIFAGNTAKLIFFPLLSSPIISSFCPLDS